MVLAGFHPYCHCADAPQSEALTDTLLAPLYLRIKIRLFRGRSLVVLPLHQSTAHLKPQLSNGVAPYRCLAAPKTADHPLIALIVALAVPPPEVVVAATVDQDSDRR